MLLRSGVGAQNYQATAAGQASQQEAAKVAELADEAFKAWKKQGHPGWSVDNMNSHCMQQLDQPQVYCWGGRPVTLPPSHAYPLPPPCPPTIHLWQAHKHAVYA